MMNSNIKNFFIFIVISTLVFFIAVFITIYKFENNASALYTAQRDNTLMLRYADILRQSSDDLTKYARLYVITADTEYKEIYYSILDIRNGDKKRPLNYHGVYWDLLEPNRSDMHPLSKKKALNEIFKELPYSKYEYDKLQKSRVNSDKLVNLEIEAFNAMDGLYRDENGNYSVYDKRDQQKAIELLHSNEYLKAKEFIMLPLDEFLTHLAQRTDAETTNLKKEMETYKSILILLLFLFILVASVHLYLIIKKILNPILYLSEAIYNFKHSRKKITEDKIFYDDEIGYMSSQFYEMRDNINSDIDKLSKSEKKAKEYMALVDKNVIISSTDLAGNITYASEAFCQISGYSKQELIGKKHSILKSNDTSLELYDNLWETITSDKIWHGEIKNRKKDGDFYWVGASIHPIYNDDDKKIGYTSIRLDITAVKRVEELLKESKSYAHKIQEYVSLVDKNIITSSTNLAGKITYTSEAFCSISGYTREELLGQNHSMVKHPDMPKELYDELWDTITNNRTWHGEIKNRRKNGGFYWVDATIYPQFDDKGEKSGYTAIRIDITDKKRVEELLVTDALTAIFNRRFFNESLPKAINKAKRDRKYFSFLMVDIDHFKQYNDRYGHQAGDNVLIEVAKCIESSINRASDSCYRLGGEEFGVLFEALSPDESYKFADNIRKNIENLKIVQENSSTGNYVTASMGLVVKKSTTDLVDDEIYKEADAYLYKAKELGRNRVEANKL